MLQQKSSFFGLFVGILIFGLCFGAKLFLFASIKMTRNLLFLDPPAPTLHAAGSSFLQSLLYLSLC